MKQSFKNYFLNIVWILLFGTIAVFFTLKGDFQAIFTVLKNINKFYFALCLICALLLYLIDGFVLRLYANINDGHYTLKQAFVNSISGGFFSGITPFSSGGQFAQVYIFKKQGVTTTKAAGILLMHFIVYQFCMVSYTLLILLFKFQYFYEEYSNFVSLGLIGFTINSAVIIALFCGAVSERFQCFLTGKVLKIGHKLHLVKNYSVAKVNLDKKLSDFRLELKIMQHNKKTILKSCGWFYLRLTLQYSIPFFTMYALGQHLTLASYFDYMGLCAFVYMITAFIPIPGASGGSEGVYVLLFSSLMGSVLASSSMLIWRFCSYYFILFVGGAFFALNREINRPFTKGDF